MLDFFSHFFLIIFLFPLDSLDVEQVYETRVADEFVILGNDALLKCGVPSFAVDVLNVIGWVTNEGHEIVASTFVIGANGKI